MREWYSGKSLHVEQRRVIKELPMYCTTRYREKDCARWILPESISILYILIILNSIKKNPASIYFFCVFTKKITFNVTRTWQKIIWQTAATLDYNCENFKCKKFFLHLFTSWNICTSNIAFNVYERKYFDFWINFYKFDLWHVNLYPTIHFQTQLIKITTPSLYTNPNSLDIFCRNTQKK